MDKLLNIYRIVLRSIIYLFGYFLFTILEHLIKGLVDGESFGNAWTLSVQYLGSMEFAINLVILFIVFLVFNAFWVIRNYFGPKALYDLYFKKSEKLG